MEKKDKLSLLSFLLSVSEQLLYSLPVGLGIVYNLYVKNASLSISWLSFLQTLSQIISIAPNAIQFDIYGEDLDSCINGKVSCVECSLMVNWLNTLVLHQLSSSLSSPLDDIENREDEEVELIQPSTANPSILETQKDLLQLLGTECHDSRHHLKKQIETLVYQKSAKYALVKERARILFEKKKYNRICSPSDSFNPLPPENESYESKYENNDRLFFVPIIKLHTDASLGDCSYLDTCHKIATCRYVHYKPKFQPISTNNIHMNIDINDTYEKARNYFFTLGDPLSLFIRPVYPPQWIQCDVRKIDFNILGKFAAVIADPAWNIHMNLPYGTCNDSELLNLPMNLLQDEGILLLWVTGRAIEIGRECLHTWGYKVINEIIWIKTNQLHRTICTGRTGHWLNHSKEHLLVG